MKLSIKKLNFVLSSSEEHNLESAKMTTNQPLKVLKEIINLKNSDISTKDIRVIGLISTSFGYPIGEETRKVRL